MADAVTDTTPPAAPAPPVVETTVSEPPAVDDRPVLEQLTREESAVWNRDGKLPERFTPSDAKPAETAKPEAAGDDAPAVDARGQQVRDQDGKFVSKKQHAANERIREAVERGISEERARREAAERRLAELEARAPKPAAAEPVKPAAAEDKPPVWEDFQKEADPFDAYQRAVARYEARQEFKRLQGEHEAKSAEQKAIDERTAVERAHYDRERAIQADVPDYLTRVKVIRDGLDPDAPLTRVLLESPVSAKLLLHFADNPAEFTRIGRLGLTNPLGAARELGKIETALSRPASAAADPPAPVVPIKKTVTSAPEPPTALGTRSAEPADPKGAAVSRKDFRTYAAEADREDLAAAGRRR